ncbi:sulfotransferase [Erythrobacter sp. SD-21]|uniref:sulfotransferase n=1 Tax=Erythrobacter sp. SD-21 TaxID=161528 RepID=UPI00030D1489|nr:sulfotransferase [Erythrobacter sp. SD-21]
MAEARTKPAATVLVTGAPRSGTTAVGELLSRSPRAIELYEPMSDIVGDRAVADWFPIPGQEGFELPVADDLVERIQRRRLRCGWRPEAIQGTQGRNRFLNRTRRTAWLARLQPWKSTQVWKDPMALMLAPRLARTTDVPVIITVRDHLSLASSYKRMEWRPPVEGLVDRMQRAGLRFDARIPDLLGTGLDPMRAGAIAWNVFYGVVLDELRAGLPATVVLNSDLMLHPEAVRQRLIAVTGLSVPAPREAAEEQSGASEDLPQKAHIANRSLESITEYWKKTLSEDEVAFGRDLNDELWAELEPEIRQHREGW